MLSVSFKTAMCAYFGTYGLTMMVSSNLFWGPSSPVPYCARTMSEGTLEQFFARIVGVLFTLAALGPLKFGVSNASFAKQTMVWNVLSLPLFYLNATSETGDFTPWVWQGQMVIGSALAIWNWNEINGGSKKSK